MIETDLYTALIEELLLSSVYHIMCSNIYIASYTVNKIHNIFKGSPFGWWTGKCSPNGFDNIFIGCSMLKYFFEWFSWHFHEVLYILKNSNGFHCIVPGCALYQVVKCQWKYSDLFFMLFSYVDLSFQWKFTGFSQLNWLVMYALQTSQKHNCITDNFFQTCGRYVW